MTSVRVSTGIGVRVSLPPSRAPDASVRSGVRGRTPPGRPDTGRTTGAIPDGSPGRHHLLSRRWRSPSEHANHQPINVRITACIGEFGNKPMFLLTGRVAVHVEVAAVLEGDVVVVEADYPHRAGGERVPQAAGFRMRPGIGQLEVRLIAAVTDWPVTQFVFVIARRRHPWPVAGRAGVVLKPVRPGADPVGARLA